MFAQIGRFFLALVCLAVATPVAVAAWYPDVPVDHEFRTQIEFLSEADVVSGNPDGSFSPERIVNRAEFLTMLYRADNSQPASLGGCFPDVEAGAWYEKVICDAAQANFVGGYPDGNFRPANQVNRVEALKMMHTVLGLPLGKNANAEAAAKAYFDVDLQAWYAPYLVSAFAHGILPVRDDGNHFEPSGPLTRGEAAAYLAATLSRDRGEEEDKLEQQSSSSSAPARVSSTPAEDDEDTSTVDIPNVSVPYQGRLDLDGNKPRAVQFTLSQNQLVDIAVTSASTPLEFCTLFRLEEDGFSSEYYIGTQEERSCYLLAALEPGAYQLNIHAEAQTQVEITMKSSAEGDGNDGFSEAVSVRTTVAKTHTLNANNLQNWYRFTVDGAMSKTQTLTLSNSDKLRCIVYAMDDVDLFGFEGPECNTSYAFPPGTYYVAIARAADIPRAATVTYTIRLQD